VSFTTCPIAEVHAPIERVWAYLAQPSNYALWWDAETTAIIPEGPVRPGQKILGRTRALAREWPVTVLVRHVDEAHHALELTTTLPLGITVHNHISCTPAGSASCRVAFG
jgi:uncharacterized protein YndB with AHSA1/START domain